MSENKDLSKFISKHTIGGSISINDLRDLEFNKEDITPRQRLAIRNFERYRLKVLNDCRNENAFHKNFQQLQVMANLSPYEEFLKEEYC